jgi:hypothetical protein
LGGGGNDAVKNTNTNEIQILFTGYQKPAKLKKNFLCKHKFVNGIILNTMFLLSKKVVTKLLDSGTGTGTVGKKWARLTHEKIKENN